jgi:hypothetical protein
MTDMAEYFHDKRWLKGSKPRAKGRVWRKGQRTRRTPHARRHYVVMPTAITLTHAGGDKVPYRITQVLPGEAWCGRYSEDDGTTFTAPLALLALAECTVNDTVITTILAIDYTEEDGWYIASEHDNFRELVPPWEEDEAH